MKKRTAIRLIIGFVIMTASLTSLADEPGAPAKVDLNQMINSTSDESSKLSNSLEDLYSAGQDSDKQFLNNEVDSSKDGRPKVSKDSDKSAPADKSEATPI